MQLMSQQNAEELNDTSKEQICFCCEDVGGFSTSDAEGVFEAGQLGGVRDFLESAERSHFIAESKSVQQLGIFYVVENPL